MGELIKVRINNFIVSDPLFAVTIRTAELANGMIQYSCRMLDDNTDIAAFVESYLE